MLMYVSGAWDGVRGEEARFRLLQLRLHEVAVLVVVLQWRL
jgi:hypothetical protein